MSGDPRSQGWWHRARAELDDLRAGVKASWGLSLETPAGDQRLRRFAHAFALPWVVLAIALRDATLRRAYLRTTLPISILTLALGAFAVSSPWTRSYFHHESDDDEVQIAPVSAEKLRSRAEKLKREAARLRAKKGTPTERTARDAKALALESSASGLETKAQQWEARLQKLQAQARAEEPDDETDDEDRDAEEAGADGGAARRRAARGEAKLAEGLALASEAIRLMDSDPDADGGQLGADASPDGGEADLAAGLALASEAIGLIDSDSADAGENGMDGGASTGSPRIKLGFAPSTKARRERDEGWQWPSLSALYGALAIIESVLLAFTREHQHQIARQLCIETGGTPEHEEARPRVRVEWKWIRKKLTRRLRGTLILLSVWLPVTLLSVVPGIGRWLSPAAAALWGFYWLGVFTLGSTHVTWTNEAPQQPAFIRFCQAVRPIPLVGWLVGLYGRLWARLVRDVRPACLTYERASLEGMGLALTRMLTGLPVINGFVRPVVPVASQLALRDRYAPPAKPATAPEPEPSA